jgi:hypothetical protein
MEVYFGTEEATRVRVRSTTELDCLTPIHDAGQIDVKVKDLDTSDEDTLTDGFTFSRPTIGGETNNTDLVYVTKTLVAEFKRQLIENVKVSHGIDFGNVDLQNFDIIEFAEVPVIILQGPRIMESGGPLHRVGEPWQEVATDTFKKKRPQDIINLEFILTGGDTSMVRLLNLNREVISFFRRNPVLRIHQDPANPGSSIEEIDMRPPFPQDWRFQTQGNKAAYKFFTGSFSLFGVPIGHDEWYDETEGITDFPDWQATPL